MTNAGVILGTAVYMSPEQAKGKLADKRTDIWAFGCVVYEMLTGKRAFDGEDLTDVVAAVVRGEPDWSALPVNVPANVRALLKGCLLKDRKARLGDIALVRYLLDQKSTEDGRAQLVEARGRPWLWIAAASVFAVAAALAIALVWTMRNRAAPLASPVRLTADVGVNISLLVQAGTTAVLSPDESVMALVGGATASAPPSLYVRRLDQLNATQFAGTEGAFLPVFSPDGNSVAFFAQGKLKKVAITGGTPVTLCDAPNGRGATWSEDGWFLFHARCRAEHGNSARAAPKAGLRKRPSRSRVRSCRYGFRRSCRDRRYAGHFTAANRHLRDRRHRRLFAHRRCTQGRGEGRLSRQIRTERSPSVCESGIGVRGPSMSIRSN